MKRWSGVRAVTFDVGGTLLEPWPSVGHVYAQVAARFGLAPDVATLNKSFLQAWRARRDFSYSRPDWQRLVQATFGSPEVSDDCFTAIYEQFAQADAWRTFDDVLPALEALRCRGLRLGVISNWDERLRPLLAAVGLAPFFETVVASHDTGHRKPDREIYARASTALRLPPDSVLHVGDSWREDVEGAESAGFRAVLLERRGTGAAVAEKAVKDLRELLEEL